MKISGKVVGGIGEGRIYMKKYMKSLEAALKMKCYSGTLNIVTKRSYAFKNPILVKPPAKGLFSVKCVHAEINGRINGAIVLPVRTRHKKNVLEIIAPVNLRKELKLVDGDIIECQIL